MKTSLKSLLVAVIFIMFCLPVTAYAKPHSDHSRGTHHQQSQHHNKQHKPKHHSSPPVQQCGMTNSQFSNFVSLVNNANFRSQKKELIESAAASNSFTVEQVIRIMNMMDFSSDKVDVAAAMYNHVCDYNNWYMVYSVFDFNMHVRELKERIGQS